MHLQPAYAPMKYLKNTLIVLAALSALLIALGLVFPRVGYQVELTVNKPLPETWAVLQDTSKLSLWLEGFQKIEPISGLPGTAGAVSNIHFLENGNTVTIKETITDLQPPSLIAMHYESAFMDMDYNIQLINDFGKTIILSNTGAVSSDPLSWLIMVTMRYFLIKQEETNLANLKKAIEQNTQTYQSTLIH